MILMANLELPQPAIREQIASALDLIIQQERLPDGKRKVVAISEVIREEGQGWGDLRVRVVDIFRFKRQGRDDHGNVLGVYQTTGYQPQIMETIHKAGINLSAKLDD